MKRFLLILLFVASLVPLRAQLPAIVVNSVPLEEGCMYIRNVYGSLDTMHGKWVGIYHAEIVGDCLELSVLYGGCKAEMEFVTDNVVISSQSYRMRFLLRYLTDATNPCKDVEKTKLRFDLTPYKALRPGGVLLLNLMGTPFTLGYRQTPN